MSGASAGRGLRRSKRSVRNDSGGLIGSDIGHSIGAPRSEKVLEQRRAFLSQDPTDDLATMIQAGQLQKIDNAAGSAASRIRAAENDAPHPDVDQCTGAHRARFFRDVKVALVQTPVADR